MEGFSPERSAAQTQKAGGKSPFLRAKIFGVRSFESSELVVHARAEDRGVVVDLSGHGDARESNCRSSVSDAVELAAAEIGVQIFAPDRDVVGDRVFNTAADHPADAR